MYSTKTFAYTHIFIHTQSVNASADASHAYTFTGTLEKQIAILFSGINI